jgi:hypothetical protein
LNWHGAEKEGLAEVLRKPCAAGMLHPSLHGWINGVFAKDLPSTLPALFLYPVIFIFLYEETKPKTLAQP